MSPVRNVRSVRVGSFVARSCFALAWSIVGIEQREHGLTIDSTRPCAPPLPLPLPPPDPVPAPSATCAHVSSANGPQPRTTMFGRKRSIGSGAHAASPRRTAAASIRALSFGSGGGGGRHAVVASSGWDGSRGVGSRAGLAAMGGNRGGGGRSSERSVRRPPLPPRGCRNARARSLARAARRRLVSRDGGRPIGRSPASRPTTTTTAAANDTTTKTTTRPRRAPPPLVVVRASSGSFSARVRYLGERRLGDDEEREAVGESRLARLGAIPLGAERPPVALGHHPHPINHHPPATRRASSHHPLRVTLVAGRAEARAASL